VHCIANALVYGLGFLYLITRSLHDIVPRLCRRMVLATDRVAVMSAVVRTDEWPRRAETVARSTPSASRRLAWLCRRTWSDAPLGKAGCRQSPETAAPRLESTTVLSRLHLSYYEMRMTDEELLQKQRQEFNAFRRALTAESDRGCALFAAAYLDQALSELLYCSFVENKNMEKELFEGTAPLATFSSRIRLAFYLGKISAGCRADLDTIRKIRNDFAHDVALISFDSQSIADRCRNLAFSYHIGKARPRAHFTSAASGILGKIHMVTLLSAAPEEKRDDRPAEAEKEAGRRRAQDLMKDLIPPTG
jgi:DNA-binding MltR family transcriptional regulator